MNLLHILVAEDEAIVREDVATFLRDFGCTVYEADNAEEAIAICGSALRVDVLFTDIHLNGSADGWEVARQFRAMRPAIGVVYASGNSGSHSESVSGSLFFLKPYASSEILAACRRLHNA